MIFIIVLLAAFAGFFATGQGDWSAWQGKFATWWRDFSVVLPMPEAGKSDLGSINEAAETPQMAVPEQEIDYTPVVEGLDPDSGVAQQTPSATAQPLNSEMISKRSNTVVDEALSPTQVNGDAFPTGEDGAVHLESGTPDNEYMEPPGVDERITPPEAKGLPAKDQILLVEFAFDSIELSPDFQHILDQAVESMVRSGESSAVITGYSDSQGAKDYNLSLSYKRADAVAQYLINRGIGQDRLQLEGRVASQDLASANTSGLTAEYGERRIVEIRINTVAAQ
jgi:outer membrane protein OmpA-like peptidoglycan-associated protein